MVRKQIRKIDEKRSLRGVVLEKNSEFLASGANTFEMDMVSREMY
jgi:hypothetical protein